MSEQKRLGEFMPVQETEGKPFQVGKYGNHRIVMKGKEGVWHKINEISTLEVDNKNGTKDIFFAVTKLHTGPFPTEFLKAVVVDEDGDSDFYQFKIVDLVKNEILDADSVFNILQESTCEQDYFISVKDSKHEDFVKIKVIEFSCTDLDKVLDRDSMVDYLVRTLDRHEFDIYDHDHVLINDCTGCDICSENKFLKGMEFGPASLMFYYLFLEYGYQF